MRLWEINLFKNAGTPIALDKLWAYFALLKGEHYGGIYNYRRFRSVSFHTWNHQYDWQYILSALVS